MRITITIDATPAILAFAACELRLAIEMIRNGWMPLALPAPSP